jgi:hypothetical protein
MAVQEEEAVEAQLPMLLVEWADRHLSEICFGQFILNNQLLLLITTSVP